MQKLFHRVAQKPGKPFWFGHHTTLDTTVFLLSGQPSVDLGVLHRLLRRVVARHAKTVSQSATVMWPENFKNDGNLTRLLPVIVSEVQGVRHARPSSLGSSGDLFGLVGSSGLVVAPPGTVWQGGQAVPLPRRPTLRPQRLTFG